MNKLKVHILIKNYQTKSCQNTSLCSGTHSASFAKEGEASLLNQRRSVLSGEKPREARLEPGGGDSSPKNFDNMKCFVCGHARLAKLLGVY